MALPAEQDSLLRRLFQSQRLAVLATRDAEQAYASLVAFAETLDLSRLLFVTGRNTRKFSNLQSHPKAALLIDNRPQGEAEFGRSVAVTAVGHVQEIRADEDPLVKCYLGKHPYLEAFLNLRSNALMSMSVRQYIVSTFHEVTSFTVGD
ncbi:MAG: pyridoxamine 5'-phosphate oxidase family protein [Chloroflexota bacterium]